MLIETRMRNVFLISRRSYCGVSFVVSEQSKGLVAVLQIIQISCGEGGSGTNQMSACSENSSPRHIINVVQCVYQLVRMQGNLA